MTKTELNCSQRVELSLWVVTPPPPNHPPHPMFCTDALIYILYIKTWQNQRKTSWHNIPKFSATAFLRGLFFLQPNMGKNTVHTGFLKYHLTKTWCIKNLNCKTKQTVHKELISASELSPPPPPPTPIHTHTLPSRTPITSFSIMLSVSLFLPRLFLLLPLYKHTNWH